MHELEPHHFASVGHLFQGHKQYLPVFAIIEGNFPGRIFVDNPDSPNTALVWAIGRWAYIEGDALNNGFNEHFAPLIQEAIMPATLHQGNQFFEVYIPDTPAWFSTIETCLNAYRPEKHLETVFTFDRQKYTSLRRDRPLSNGARIERVDLPILPDSIHTMPCIAAHFKTRNTPGFKLTCDGRALSLCRLNGFVYGNECMIAVATFDETNRGKGYATAVGVALIDFCLEHHYVPLWETTEHNLASRGVARKLGFVEHATYPVYAILFS